MSPEDLSGQQQQPMGGAMVPMGQPAAPAPEPLKLSPRRKGAAKKAKTRNYRSVMLGGWGSWVRRLPIFDFRTIEEMLRDDMVSLCLTMRAAPIAAVEFAYRDLHSAKWVPGIRASHDAIGIFVLRQLHTIWRNLDSITDAQKWGWSAGEITLTDTRFGTVEIDRLLPRRAMDTQVLVRGGFPVGVRFKGVEDGQCDLMYPYCWWHAYNPIPGSNYGQSVLYAAQSPWWDKWQEGGALDVQRLFMHSNAYGGADVAYPAGKTHIDGRGLVDNYEIAYDIATQLRTGSVTTRPCERDDKGNEKWIVSRGVVASNPQHIHDWPDKCDDRIRVALGVPDDLITSDGGTGAWAGKRIPMAAFYSSLDTWVTRMLKDLEPVIKALVKLNFGDDHWFELEHKPMSEKAMEEQQGQDPMGGGGGMGGADPMDPFGGMGMDPTGGAEMGFDDPAGGEVPGGDMGGALRMSLAIEDEDGEDAEEKANLIIDILASIFGEDAESVLEELLGGGVQRMSLGRVWNSDDHPRGPNGRFIKKGTEEGYNAAAAAVTHVRKNRKDPEGRTNLMKNLKNLTVKQLNQLKKAYGVRASGRVRADLVQKLSERLGHYKHSVVEKDNETPVSPHIDMVYAVPSESLNIDPKRFQYKVQGIRADGVTDEMREVEAWNPMLGGVLLVWRDPDTGEDFVVNGHHRYELAVRAGQDVLNVRYIDADNAKMARAQGALANIAEGRGTAVDAAKFMRDSGISIGDLKKHGVSLKGKVAEDALALTALSDETFQKVAEGRLKTEWAVGVAKNLKDHKLQDMLFKKLLDREEENKDWSPRQIERASLKMAAAGKVTEVTESLFGDWEDEKSTFDQEVDIEDFVAAALKTQKFDFQAIANAKRAGRVSGAGNVLAVEENARRKAQAEMALETFEREARLKSPISAKIKELAVELAEAKGKTAQDAVKEKAKAEIIAEIEAIQSGKPKEPEPAPVETPPAEPETPKPVVNAVEELPAEGRIVKDIPAESVFSDSNRRYLDVPYKSKDTAKELGAHWDPKKKQWFTFGDDQAARVKSVLDGSAYKFAMENANDEQRERLKNYAKNFGENSKMVSMVADEIENQMKKADKTAPEGGVPGAQQLLFDVGRKTDAPGQSLMFEDEDQRPREAPPLVSSEAQKGGNPPDIVYSRGDAGRRTGKIEMLHGGEFEQLEMLEGVDAGKLKWVPTTAQKDADAARAQNDWKEQQAGFKRLREGKELEDKGLIRKWGDRWQYRISNGQYFYANDKQGAIDTAKKFLEQSSGTQSESAVSPGDLDLRPGSGQSKPSHVKGVNYLVQHRKPVLGDTRKFKVVLTSELGGRIAVDAAGDTPEEAYEAAWRSLHEKRPKLLENTGVGSNGNPRTQERPKAAKSIDDMLANLGD